MEKVDENPTEEKRRALDEAQDEVERASDEQTEAENNLSEENPTFELAEPTPAEPNVNTDTNVTETTETTETTA